LVTDFGPKNRSTGMRKVFHSFQFKLTISLFLIVLVILGSLYFVINRTTHREFKKYVVRGEKEQQFRDFIARPEKSQQFRKYVIQPGGHQFEVLRAGLKEYYQSKGSWEGVDSILKKLSTQVEGGESGGGSGENSSGKGEQVVLVGNDGKIVASSYGDDLIGREVSGGLVQNAVPIESNGERIGVLVSEDLLSVRLDNTAQQFLASVRRNILYAGIAGLVIAMIIGWILFRQLTEPLNKLMNATKKISSGDLDHEVSVDSEDELGKLGSSFNRMARNLRESEEIRQRMISDIAHELRTPLTVLSGKVEAITDGVYEPTEEKLHEIQEELNLLNRLVEDLRELTLAEADELELNRSPVSLVHLVKRTVNSLEKLANRKEIELKLDLPESVPELELDADRISQVLNNLIKNSLRHTGKGDTITVRVMEKPDQVLTQVIDTGEGVPEDKIDHVFDRFYRGDSSRSSEGSGLGLTITKELVQSHGGDIWIESEPGEGTLVSFSLPK